jgi:hypothetical protein
MSSEESSRLSVGSGFLCVYDVFMMMDFLMRDVLIRILSWGVWLFLLSCSGML